MKLKAYLRGVEKLQIVKQKIARLEAEAERLRKENSANWSLAELEKS